jgi:hypothetical protein
MYFGSDPNGLVASIRTNVSLLSHEFGVSISSINLILATTKKDLPDAPIIRISGDLPSGFVDDSYLSFEMSMEGTPFYIALSYGNTGELLEVF